MTNPLYGVKDFSRLTGVTARTLQYYDEIGLLKPHHRTEAGYRLYSEDDLLILQQITTLKFMGFNLNQIKAIILDNAFDIESSLNYQSLILSQEANKLNKASRLIKQMQVMLKEKGNIDWHLINNIIEVLQMTDQNIENWANHYFSKEERAQFDALLKDYDLEQQAAYSKKWEELFNKVKRALPLEPSSKQAQQLATEWEALLNEVYGDLPEIRQKLWEAFKAGAVPKETMPYYDQDVIDFIDAATQALRASKQ